MKANLKRSSVVVAAMLFAVATLNARPAAAQATYTYQGNSFNLFSCGPNSTNTATLNCSTPAPTNPYTSYTTLDRVTAILTLASPLPANLSLQDIRTFAGFTLTLNDGQHTVTDLQAVGMFAEVATDAAGDIVQWRLVINTGGTLNGGISTSNTPFVSDTGTLSCCDPTVSGDFARVFSNPGSWTVDTGAPTPSEATTALIAVLNDPAMGLTAGQISSLTDKLTNALSSIEAGLNKQAINQLNAFINSVDSSAKNGKISTATAAVLIAAANAIIAVL